MDPMGFKVKQVYIDNGLAWWMCLVDHPKSISFLVLKKNSTTGWEHHVTQIKFTTQNNKESVQTKRKSFASHLWCTKMHIKIYHKYILFTDINIICIYIYIFVINIWWINIYITDVYIYIIMCNINIKLHSSRSPVKLVPKANSCRKLTNCEASPSYGTNPGEVEAASDL